MTTRDLLEKRASLVAEMRQIAGTPNGDGGDLSTEQSEKFNSLKGALEKIESQIERQKYLDECERRMNDGQTISGHNDDRLDMELRSYSLRRAIAGAAGLEVDWAREKELSTEIARRSGRTFQGVAVPLGLFTHMPIERRVLTTALPAGGPGGNIIADDFRADQFIDILRPNSVVYRMGARILTGLVGDVVIPRLKASTNFAWVAENAALTPADPELEQVTLAPKHGGSVTEFSRNLLLQSSPDIEQLLRMDMARNIASGIDQVAIRGGAANQPTGILATSGIGDVGHGADGGAPTWLTMNQLVETVANANGPLSAGFITNHKVVRKLRTTPKVASTDSVMVMESRDSLLGYPLSASTNVPSNLTKGSGTNLSAIIFGDLSELLIGAWSELDVLVNPFESGAYLKGNVLVRSMASLDIKLRHPASFAAAKDLVTT